MGSGPQLTSLPSVQAMRCGPHYHRITAAHLSLVKFFYYCAQLTVFLVIIFVGNVTLLPLERLVSRNDIECPGDVIPYTCSVQSNSENIMLMWLITFPGQATLNISYTNFSDTATTDLGMNVTTVVTDNERGDFLVSLLEIMVLQNVSMNGTQIECRGEDLDREVATVHVNTSGLLFLSVFEMDVSDISIAVPLIPSGFNITGVYFTVTNITVLFEWDEPQGSGPETIVDDYIIDITPSPLSPYSLIVQNSPLNVTLRYNVDYTTTITAVNCAGESPTYQLLPNIEYGECS